MSDMSGEFMENCGFEGKMLREVVRQYAPCDSRDTTTSEQLAEIDRDMAEIERQVAELVEEAQRADYPQPEPETTTEQLAEIEEQPEPIQVRKGRWRTRNGLVKDVTAMPTDHEDYAAAYPWWDGVSTWRNDGRWLAGGSTMDLVEYLGPIEAEPQPQPEPEPQPVQVREGPWRTRSGEVKNIRSCEPLKGAYYVWPWTDGIMTFQDNGRHQGSQESAHDLVEYLGPIEQQPEPEPQPQPSPESDTELQAQVAFLKGREVTLGTRLQQEKEVTTRLRGELESVQVMLGESRQRVTQLEELVTSLRTINEGAEKAVSGAGVVNDSLRLQLAAVKAELASVAADRQRLLIELDAAQQVPADSPELRQLRAELEQVTRERDQHLDSYQRIFGDLETIRETTKAAAVEAIVEWLVPIRTCGSQALATAVVSNLPHIMRSLTGLEDEEIE